MKAAVLTLWAACSCSTAAVTAFGLGVSFVLRSPYAGTPPLSRFGIFPLRRDSRFDARVIFAASAAAPSDESSESGEPSTKSKKPKYDLGTKEAPLHLRKFANANIDRNATMPPSSVEEVASHWVAPEPVKKPTDYLRKTKAASYTLGIGKHSPVVGGGGDRTEVRTRKIIPRDEEGQILKGALWDEGHYDKKDSGDGGIREAVDEAVREATDGEEARSSATTPAVAEDAGGGSRLVGAHIDGAGGAAMKTWKPPEPLNGGAADNNDAIMDDVVEAAAEAAVKQMISDVEEQDDVAFAADPRLEFALEPPIRHEDIDLSVPLSVYDPENGVDVVWDLMKYEARVEALREPLLVSFLHSTILNHPTLESALAFHLANKLSSPSMIGTQLMALISEALDSCKEFRRTLRADMLAVRDRDPACTCLPDVFLYFKGFHALQTHRVARCLWSSGRRVLAHYLQSQVSQSFQIDIHPNATLGSGIMLDHGTGIVVGETASVGHNCSILHHVTLGGSGKKGVDRHPKVGNGVLLGAGASVLGNIVIGDGCQVGAGTLVIADLPPHTVAVGVPAKIIGSFVDVSAQPALGMNQLGSKEADATIVTFETEGI